MIEPRVVDRPHSRPFSPSSADIALHCSKYIQFVLEGARRSAGEAARRGTAQHEAFGVCWHRGIEPTQVPAVWVDGERIELTGQEHEAIAFALDWCRPQFAARKIVIERLLRSTWGGLFGYADLVALDEPLTVLDLKFGWQPIQPTSTQLGLYALMLAIEVHRSIEGSGSIRTIILQPRNPDPIRIYDWPFAELRALLDRLLETLDRIRRQDFTYNVGGHCRWCAVAGTCPALAATAKDAAAAAVAPAEPVARGEFGREHLERMLELAPAFEHLARQTRMAAKQYLLNGGKLANLKLVRKRTGGVTVADRPDPRAEIDVAAMFEAASRSMAASAFRSAARK
jgi:hypothetical protein